MKEKIGECDMEIVFRNNFTVPTIPCPNFTQVNAKLHVCKKIT